MHIIENGAVVTSEPNPFPVDLLPRVMADFVREASAVIGCDASYVALPLLASLGKAIGNKRILRLRPDWDEPPIIWAAVISDSGEVKTPSYKVATRFLREVENKKRGEGDDDATYIATDATFAGVREAIHAQQDSSLLLMPDELVDVLGSLGRGGQSATKKGHWLSWWQGGELRTLRYNKRIHVPRASVSIIGGIQPDVFRRTVLKERSLNDGLCARFLLTWQPPNEPAEWTDKGVSVSTTRKMRAVFTRLLSMTTKKYEGGSYNKPDAIRLNDLAHDFWKEFHNKHRREAHLLDRDLKAAWNKLLSYTARIALIWQMVTWAANEKKDLSKDCLEVSALAMTRAIAIVKWFKGEGRRIYTLFSETDEQTKHRELLDVIRRNGGSIIPRTLMRRSGRYKSAREAKEALRALCKAGFAREAPFKPEKGRPTMQFSLIEKPNRSKARANGSPSRKPKAK